MRSKFPSVVFPCGNFEDEVSLNEPDLRAILAK